MNLLKDTIVEMYGVGVESERILYQLERDLKVDMEEETQENLPTYEELWGNLTPEQLMELPDEF